MIGYSTMQTILLQKGFKITTPPGIKFKAIKQGLVITNIGLPNHLVLVGTSRIETKDLENLLNRL